MTDAQVYIHIQYCGGWGYRSKCNRFKQDLEAMQPNTFQFKFDSDTGTTGNFDVKVHKAADYSDEGVLVYSNTKSGGFPYDSEEKFTAVHEAIKAACQWVHSVIIFHFWTFSSIQPQMKLPLQT